MRPDFESRFRQLLLASFALLVALALAAPAGAIPVSVTSSNLPTCDPLLVPDAVDELGNQWAFPPDEAIGSVAGPASFDSGCSPYDPVVFVRITNLRARDFTGRRGGFQDRLRRD
jgi:hypothetical protein